jgi:hypothetical protein
LEYLLFVAYLILFAWLVTQTRFFINTGLSKHQLVIIFLLKVIAGIFYGWMGIYYADLAQMLDTWAYHRNGLLEYQLLSTNPEEYFTNLFNNPYPGGWGNFFASSNSYWNDLKGNIFNKTLSVFDIFSFGNYYINVIFFTYIAFFGVTAAYRVMKEVFPDKKWLVFLGVFFVPSFFYWSSGINKEGLIFLGLALIIFQIYFGNKENRWGVKRWTGLFLGFFLLLVLRNFLLVIMVPAVTAWALANKWPRYGAACFTGVYSFFIILFFTLRYINPQLDFPQAVVDKQQSFVQIVGNSSIPIKELKPTVISFVKTIPQAITLSALRPYPKDIRHLLSLAAAIEIALIVSLFVLLLFFRKRKAGTSSNTLWFYGFLSFSLFLAIGFSVNNLGAIVRYRSIILPFLVTSIVASIDWEKVRKIVFSNIKINNN